MRQALRVTALFALVAGLFVAGTGLSAQAARIGVLDRDSVRFATTPQASLADLAYQQLGMYPPMVVSRWGIPPAVTYGTPLQVDSNPGGANPFVDPEWNMKLNMQPGGQPTGAIPEPGAALLFAAGFGAIALRLRGSARG